MFPTRAQPGALRRPGALLPGAIAVAAAARVSWPLASRFFKGDDFVLLYRFENWGLWDSMLRPYMGHVLLVPNAIFYAIFQRFRMWPAPMLWLALATHLASVWLLYAAGRRLTGRPWVAAFWALLWGISPVGLVSVGWPIVYGQVLATFCVALVCFEFARRQPGTGAGSGSLAGIGALLCTAGFCFGSGLAAAVAAPVWACPLLDPARGRLRAVAWLALVAALTFGCWIGLIVSFGPGGFLTPLYAYSANWREMLVFFAELLSYGTASLLAGPLLAVGERSIPMGPLAGGDWRQALGARSAVPALAFAVVLAVAAIRAKAPARRWLAALVLLAVSSYLIIAAAREPAFGHIKGVNPTTARYHYLGSFAISLLGCVALGSLLPRSPPLRWVGVLALALWASLLGPPYLRAGTLHQAYVGRDSQKRYEGEVRGMRLAIQRARGASPRVPNRAMFASKVMFPGRAALFTLYWPASHTPRRSLRFVERNRKVYRPVMRHPESRVAQLIEWNFEPAPRRRKPSLEKRRARAARRRGAARGR